MNKIAIHQFTPTIAYGDGVSNGVLLTQKLLQELGFISNIYICDTYIDVKFKHEVFHVSQYKESKENFLLYHHSIGHTCHSEIMRFEDKKILVYHNITPSYFFTNQTLLQEACERGRQQLKDAQKYVVSSYADSSYNAKELNSCGYKNSTVLALLMDFEIKKKVIPNSDIVQKYSDSFNILFVGRIVQNKAQHQLIDVAYLLKQQGINLKLFIVGGISQPDYFEYLRFYRANLDLKNEVVFTSKVNDEDLEAYFKNADLYLSLSEHEGFGIPLIEAMRYDIPVFAYNAGAIDTTITKEGLLEKKAPIYVAERIIFYMQNPTFRVEIIKEQKKILKCYRYKVIKQDLYDYLKSLDIPLPKLYNKRYKSQKISKNIQLEGPFDSSYSLSIVNRNLAKSLYKDGVSIKLYSTEGYGDFKPNSNFLKQDDLTNKLYKKRLEEIDITIRNLYPPRTNAMSGYHKIFGPYGWEESAFPSQFIDNFNARLTLIACMSNYVKDVMIKNGIKVPLVVTGIGADHILNHKASEIPYILPSGFRLLHISSCFPRKGIEILLEVFEQISYLDISLVIKTFPNPHNNASLLIEKLPLHVKKKILLINEELTFSQINYLYENCDCLVAPSYGEGFGLPMAEAMLFDLPVVTTAYGGQSDFCFEDTAWLIDYSFEKAQTHFKLFNSYWAKPDKKSLKKTILELFYADKLEISKKTKKARDYILHNYKWQDVVKSLKNSIENYKEPKNQKRDIAWISSYNTKCGIAEYSASLLNYLENDFVSIQIFANKTKSSSINDLAKEKAVKRDWIDRFDLDNHELIEDLKNGSFADIVIQFNFAFFSMKNLQEIIEQNLDKNIFLELHSVEDVTIKGLEASLGDIKESLERVNQIIVHNISDLNILKNFGIVQNVTLLPLGIKEYDMPSVIKKDDKPLIASFGFLLPHKGILELIEAFYYVKKSFADCKLLLLNSLYPSPVSEAYYHQCKQKIDELGLQDSVIFNTEYLSQEEIIKRLSKATLLVLPYKDTQESASASVRDLISTNRPVLATKKNIFNDISDIIHFIQNDTPKGISDDIIDLLSDTKRLYSKQKLQQEWIEEHSWDRIVLKYENILKIPKYISF